MRMLRESESRVNFFKQGAGRNANERENELIDNKMNITIQNKLMNYVKNDIKSIIDGILNRYDSIVYYHKYKRFYKGHYGILEIIKDKVNLAIACFNKNISKYNTNGTLDKKTNSIWLNNLIKGQLRRNNRNRVK
jgi:hypothetical protein